jgi:Tfp pilus assembly protein PilF
MRHDAGTLQTTHNLPLRANFEPGWMSRRRGVGLTASTTLTRRPLHVNMDKKLAGRRAATVVRLFKPIIRGLPMSALVALGGCFSQPVVKPLPPLAPIGQARPAQAEATSSPIETNEAAQGSVSGFEEQNLVAPATPSTGTPAQVNPTGQATAQTSSESPPSAAAVAGAPSGTGQITAAGSAPSAAAPSATVAVATTRRQDAALISDISDFNNVTDLSNRSLNSLIDDSMPAARAASIRVVEQARQQIQAKDSVSALQLLSQAISIDPTNPYAYFYLGRVYLAKRNAAQALTFFRRAEQGFSSDPQWLAETQAFEGCAYELDGNTEKAQEAYRNALAAASGNYLAQVGYARIAAADLRTIPGAPTGSAGGPAQATSEGSSSANSAPAPNENATPDEPAAPEQSATPDEGATEAEGNQAQRGGTLVPDDPAAAPEEPGAQTQGAKQTPDDGGGADDQTAPDELPKETPPAPTEN